MSGQNGIARIRQRVVTNGPGINLPKGAFEEALRERGIFETAGLQYGIELYLTDR